MSRSLVLMSADDLPAGRSLAFLNGHPNVCCLRPCQGPCRSIESQHDCEEHPLVVYYCGINDLHFGADVEVPVANLRRFHSQLREALPNTKLLVLAMNRSPLHYALGMQHKIERSNQLIQQLAEEQRFECVDLFSQEPRFAYDTSLYAWDMLHFTPSGYSILGRMLRPYLCEPDKMDRTMGVTLDTSGEPYTHLLIYAGNSILMSEYASAIALEDSRITCRNDVYAPCPKGQVLKDEEMLPYGCQGERCTAQECCWDAGTCSDFLNGTNISAQSKGCADGYIALQNPPEFCAGTQCNSSDCCLQTAEAMGSVEIAAVSSSWDSIQVSWTVPTLNDCIFQEYQVQLLAENSSNSTWQDVAMGCSQLRDSCGSSCVVWSQEWPVVV
eukprot:symbB.v1.2.007683.t2/scaffold476.1/size199034/2